MPACISPRAISASGASDYDACLRKLVTDGGIDRLTPKGIKPRERLVFKPLPQPGLFGEPSG